MPIGICQLCGQRAELVDSHVWPKFAYKRYVSNLSRGGQFLDLRKKRADASRHYTRPWFCERCDRDVLGNNEKYAAEFCMGLDKSPTSVHGYDGRLLAFAVSISWRTAKAWCEGCGHKEDETLKRACMRWKEFLRGKVRHLGPYTQHLFVIFDQEVPLHKGIGGEVIAAERLVLSQIGPLFIVGLLDRRHLPVRDLAIWSHSKLNGDGGTIAPVIEWRVGSQITADLARVLKEHELRTKLQIVELGLAKRRKGDK